MTPPPAAPPRFGAFSLRVAIPAALLLLSAIFVGLVYRFETTSQDRELERQKLAEFAVSASRLQSTLNYAAQRGDIVIMRAKVGELGADPDIEDAWLSDGEDRVLASTRLEWLGRRLQELLPGRDPLQRKRMEAAMAGARSRSESTMVLDSGSDAAFAAYPVMMGIRKGEARPSDTGLLVVNYTLVRARAANRARVSRHVATYSAFLLLMSLSIGLLMDRLVSRRLKRIVADVERFHGGDEPVVIPESGRDEIANVARGLNRMMEKLREDMRFLNDVIENIPIMLFVKDARDLRFVRLNRAGEELLGYGRKDFLGRNDYDFFPKAEAEHFVGKDREVLELGQVLDIPEEMVETRTGERRVLHTRKIPIIDEQGKAKYLLGISEDITDIKRTRKIAAKAEAEWSAAMDALDDAACLLDPRLRIVRANQAFHAMTGTTARSTEHNSVHDVLNPAKDPAACTLCHLLDERHDFVAVLEGGDPANPASHPVEARGRVVRDREGQLSNIFLLFHDLIRDRAALHEKAELEAQLFQAQKMEAVGHLAGGIAHDFNNMLTAILGYGTLLKGKVDPASPMKLYVDEILSSAEKSTNLTRQLLAFSRKQIIAPRETDLNGLVRGIEKLLRRLIGEDVQLKTKCTDHVLTVMVDPGQFEQVLMNLSTNARDAMPNGGLLTISTDAVELDALGARHHGLEKTGRYGLVVVSDSGSGMDAKTRGRIFEPFFTTKETGKGTGLGLSIVYGIVKQHNGTVTVYSEPGQGTTFRIYLPLTDAGSSVNAHAEAVEAPAGGSETILVCEDNPDVRALLRHVLEDAGYKVLEAVDGADAVERFSEEGAEVRLVIMDLIMPEKNGREVAEEIGKARPGTAVLFVSGYTADIIHKQGILDEKLDFLAKPVAPPQLLAKVREMLDRRAGGA